MRELCRFTPTRRPAPKVLFRKELRRDCRQSRMQLCACGEDAGLQERGSTVNSETGK